MKSKSFVIFLGMLVLISYTFSTTPLEAGTPKISVSPMSINFGNVKLGGTSGKTITIKNTGTSDLLIGNISISGSNASEFSQTNSCATIPIHASCTITVIFNPTLLPFGQKSATVSISSNDPIKPTVGVKLSGNAAPPNISASPMSVNFGSVEVAGTSSPKMVTIKNTGISDLVISNIAITGTNAPEFNQTNNCTTIPKGESCTATVTFAPTSQGKKSGMISISSNDTKKPTVNAKLSGNAICTYSISSSGQQFDALGGTGSVDVNSPSGCSWTVESKAPWISIITGGSGSGFDTITYGVAANTSIRRRTGKMIVAKKIFTVVQSGQETSDQFVQELVDLDDQAVLGEISTDEFVTYFGQILEMIDNTPAGPESLKTYLEKKVLGYEFDYIFPESETIYISEARVAQNSFLEKITESKTYKMLEEFLKSIVFNLSDSPIPPEVLDPRVAMSLSSIQVRTHILNSGLDGEKILELMTILGTNPYEAERQLLKAQGKPIPPWLEPAPSGCLRNCPPPPKHGIYLITVTTEYSPVTCCTDVDHCTTYTLPPITMSGSVETGGVSIPKLASQICPILIQAEVAAGCINPTCNLTEWTNDSFAASGTCTVPPPEGCTPEIITIRLGAMLQNP